MRNARRTLHDLLSPRASARRRGALLATLALAAATASGIGHAQVRRSDGTADYPNRPIRFIVPFSPGGGTDFVTRLFAQRLTEAWGHQVVVDNRPGAGGVLGTDIVARATPDGYTLLTATGGHTINPHLYKKLQFDPLKSFDAVTLLARVPTILSANPALPASNVAELVTLARARPGQISFASFGYGSTSHLTGELLRVAAKIDLLHIPYKGAGDAMGPLLGGQVNLMFSAPAAVLPQFRSGKLKGIALTGTRRAQGAPDIPTFAEQGYTGVEAGEWYSVLVPAGTPKPIIAKLHAELTRILRLPDITERLVQVQAADPVGGGPQELQAFIEADYARWARLVKDANIALP
jgi:tripartite-type tricarboxylate transporter receptor subunit TctC